MLVPDDLRYSADHEWVRVEGDLLRVGLTDYAQDALGEITLVQLLDEGRNITAGDELGEIEAFKAMTDLYMPVTATIVEHNGSLHEMPDRVNKDPYGDGWLCVVRPSTPSDVEQLLDSAGYRALIGDD